MEEIISFVDGLDGVLTQRAHSGDGSPEIAWGDTFFYYAPDGVVPSATQPFATIVTKNYPGDETSRLERPGVFRVNMAAGKEEFIAHVGRAPRDADPDVDAECSWSRRAGCGDRAPRLRFAGVARRQQPRTGHRIGSTTPARTSSPSRASPLPAPQLAFMADTGRAVVDSTSPCMRCGTTLELNQRGRVVMSPALAWMGADRDQAGDAGTVRRRRDDARPQEPDL